MQKALLINPWIYDFGSYDLWMKPVGLLRVAEGLRKQGYKLSFFDCLNSRKRNDNYGCGKFTKKMVPKPNAIKDVPRLFYRYGVPLEDFLNIKEKPDAVFVGSGMTYWYLGVQEVIKLVREKWGDIPVTLGGTYAILCSDHAAKYSGADIVDSKQGCRINGSYPAWDLLSSTESMVIQTSYGCPFDCKYCAINKLCSDFSQRDPGEVADEIEYYIEKYSPKDIAFYDDALLVNAENHFKPLLKEILSRNIKCRFHTPNGLHARFLDRETADLMKKAGFVTLRLSLETSGNKRKDHKVTNEEFLKAVRYFKEAGFGAKEINVYTMFGTSGDTPYDIMEDIKFVVDTAKVPIKLGSYSLVPGSDDFNNWKGAEELDPLWHNNTIFPLLGGKYTIDNIWELRQFASAKNKELLRGIYNE